MSRRIFCSAGLGFVFALAAVAGCYTGGSVDTNLGPGTVVDTDESEPVEPTPDAGKASKATGLPCDVTAILDADCATCHGATLSGGAPNRLMTYADLAKASAGDPKVTVAALSLQRMKSNARPMPPTGKLEADRVAAFAKWVADGLPRGTCAPVATTKDAGPAEPDASPPVSTCTSGKILGGTPGELMKPGQACIACHKARGGPPFTIAGTVYPSLHEPNDCHGSSDVKVVIIDATGTAHTLPTNAAGSFVFVEALPRPYRALVVRGTTVREMRSLQTDGDCNGCHTEWGTRGAPGRVMAP